MYFLTTKGNAIPHFDAFLNNDKSGHVSVREIFAPLHPLNLFFFTYHEDEPDSHLIMSLVNPEDTFYFSLPKDETHLFYQYNKLHRHNFYELLFVIDGSIYQSIEHKRHLYPKGSCCLLNKNVRHSEEYHHDLRVVFVQFTAEFIMKLLNFLPRYTDDDTPAYREMKLFFMQDLAPTSVHEKKYLDFIPREAAFSDHVHICFENMLREMQSGQLGFTFRLASLLIELLCHLFDGRFYQNTPAKIGSNNEKSLFDDVTNYLAGQHGRVSRNELAGYFHYSGDYLYKVVRKYTGLSLFDYSMKFCLKRAARLLTDSNQPIQQIAIELGFSNISHFYRLFFEEYQMTPRSFRIEAASPDV